MAKIKKTQLVLLLFVIFIIGCAPLDEPTEVIALEEVSLSEPIEPITESPTQDLKLRIGSFNIQTFGTTKAEDIEIMEVLVATACNFDILAIQELRDSSDIVLNSYLEKINEACPQYQAIKSEPLGRTTYKENYAFIYNTEKVSLIESVQFSDNEDVFEREPFLARFNAHGSDFFLLNVHIDPDEAESEIFALQAITLQFQEMLGQDAKIIVLGDLNADCSYFDEEKLEGLGFYSIIQNEEDTTTGNTNCTYDRILITPALAGLFSGNAGVYRIDEEFDFDSNFMGEISDHYPVWAEFRLG